jgi:arylformamidase
MKTIDLSYTMEPQMTTYPSPWHCRFNTEVMGDIDVAGRRTCRITMGSHSGTHMDAPAHFIKDGGGIDGIDLSKVIGPVSIIDFSDLKHREVSEDDLKGVRLSSKTIFKFGWSKYWKSDKFYVDYPYFSISAAKYIVNSNVELMGMDTPSPDPVTGKGIDSPVHKIMMKSGVLLLEYLANTDMIDDCNGWSIAALPLKILGGDGCPCRVVIYR